MMTAGQIVNILALEQKVTINYRAAEFLNTMIYQENPMPLLEFSKYDCDFKWMQYENAIYSTTHMFPSGVDFLEPAKMSANGLAPDDKEGVFKAFPENDEKCQKRGNELIEEMNKAILEESENGTKNVLFLMISHGIFVDQLANVMTFLNSAAPPINLLSITEAQRRMMLDYACKQKYEPSDYCSITGFKIEKSGILDPVFKRYKDHCQEAGLLSIYSGRSLIPEKPEIPIKKPDLEIREVYNKEEYEEVYQIARLENAQRPSKIQVLQATSGGFEAGNFVAMTIDGHSVFPEENSTENERGLHFVVYNP